MEIFYLFPPPLTVLSAVEKGKPGQPFYGVWIARKLHPDPRLLRRIGWTLAKFSDSSELFHDPDLQRWNSMQILQKMLSSACNLFMRESSFEESRGGCPY